MGKMPLNEAIKESSEKLAVQWWEEQREKFGEDYARDIARNYANKILELSGGRKNYDNRSND